MTAHTPEDLAHLAHVLADEADPDTRWLRTTDPAALTQLATALADRLSTGAVDAVLTWDRPDDAVFAHALAAALGVRVLRADLDLGLWSVEGDWPAEPARLAIVSTGWGVSRSAAPLTTLCRERGHKPAMLVSALADPTDASRRLAGELDCELIVAERA